MRLLIAILPFVLCGCFIFSSNDGQVNDVDRDSESDTADAPADVQTDATDAPADIQPDAADALADRQTDIDDTLFNDLDVYTTPENAYLQTNPTNPMWLQLSDGTPFFVCGTSTPDEFLYLGLEQSDGTREGDQEEIISRLADTGANSLYVVAVRDEDEGPTHNPFVNHDPDEGLNPAIIAQWNEWLDATDAAGIAVLFNIYDDVEHWRGEDPAGEAAFIRELVTALRHHTHLIWVVAESHDVPSDVFTLESVASRIAMIHAADPHHPVAASTSSAIPPGIVELLPESDVHAFELPEPETATENREEALSAWSDGPPSIALLVYESAYPIAGRETRHSNWALALAGINVMVHGWFNEETADADLAGCGYLHRFMESTTLFELGMQPDDNSIAAGSAEYLFGNIQAGTFLAYAISLEGSSVKVSGVPAAAYDHRWFDPATGYEYAGPSLDHEESGRADFIRPDGLTTPEVAVFVSAIDTETAAIGGQVRLDADGDGDLFDDDAGIAHIRVELFDEDARSPRAVTTTDDDGRYLFIHLPPATYEVVVDDPAGYRSTQDTDSGNDDRVTVRLESRDLGDHIHFLAEPIPSSASGQVRLDRLDEGNLSHLDPGLPNVVLELFADSDCDGASDGEALGTATTDAFGRYVLEGVAGGPGEGSCDAKSYVVVETDPEGYTSSADSDGSGNGPSAVIVELPTATSSATAIDFLDAPE